MQTTLEHNPRRAVLDALRKILSEDRVVTDPATLLTYDCDGFTIARSQPGAVVFCQSRDEVVEVVKLLARENVQIVPRGTGTGLAGGCVAFDGGIVVSIARMNRIHKIDLASRYAEVDCGVRNTQLSEAVARLEGGAVYHFAPDPSSQRASSIGGNAATNAGGIHTLKDFVSSNHVLGMEMVLADGRVTRIGATGGGVESPIDLPALVCGSEGTLGIITRLWVRLAPKRSSFRTMLGFFDSQLAACDAVSRIISAGHLPAAMEMMDGRMVQVVENTFHLGIPPGTEALILCEIDGIDAMLDDEAARVKRIMTDTGATSVAIGKDAAERTKLWKARKGAFGAIGKISPSYCTQDACVPRSMLSQVLSKVDEIGKAHGMTINNVFHAGDGNVHPIFLYDDRDPQQMKNTLAAAEKILEYCIDLGGTITGEHGVGVEKLHLMPYLFDQNTLEAFNRIKFAFDPGERINAGKLIPSDKFDFHMISPGRKAPQ